jgi:hypothetical protein
MQSLLFGDKNLVILATPVVIISDAAHVRHLPASRSML